MKGKKTLLIIAAVVLLVGLTSGIAYALTISMEGPSDIYAGFLPGGDDGPKFTRNISRTPHTMTGGAQISVMDLYVPAVNTQGEENLVGYLTTMVDENGVESDCSYQTYDPDGDENGSTLPEGCAELLIDHAKPLFASYEDGIFDEELNAFLGIDAVSTGTGFGIRDAFGTISLDDGQTWKDTNLSNSADKSSFILKTTGEPYPGDVFRIEHEVVGNKVAVAWISRYCESGNPLYAWDDLEKDSLLESSELLKDYPHLFNEGESVSINPTLYMTDTFGVAGSQQSVDYTLQGFPEVAEIPYGCVWVARGTLEYTDVFSDTADNTQTITQGYDIIWRQAERLTSGRRDANRVDITGTSGAGFVISWQEDPEGLRPGKGLGPGEGWSGAIVNNKTDIWYSYIGWDDFDDVADCTTTKDENGNVTDVTCDYRGELDGLDTLLDGYVAPPDEKPKIAVPFSIPMRLTDNNMCKWLGETPDITDPKYQPYCYELDLDDGVYDDAAPAADEISDLCVDYATVETGKLIDDVAVTKDVCVAQDGRVLSGRTGSSRVRWALKPYTTNVDADGDGVMDVSAWVVMAEEKMKGLGTETYDSNGVACEPNPDDPYDDCEAIDLGKDMWYHTFDMFHPELVQQGLMLNSPAKNPDPLADGYPDAYFPAQEFTYDIGGVTDAASYLYHPTEIARRFNLIVNSVGAAQASVSRTMALLIYKEGIINQGGPADIFYRRIVLPTEFDPAVDNPYDYGNVVCDAFEGTNPGTFPADVEVPAVDADGMLYTEGENPHYVRGLCTIQGVNISGSTILACDNDHDPLTCAQEFPWNFGADLDDGDPNTVDPTFPKVTQWTQCDGTTTNPLCGNVVDALGNIPNNFDDPSWASPYDVSKGHRGFIDGDYIMFMYATAQNWKANTTGNDKYNIYIRRSFNGGETWTTTPAASPWTDVSGVVADGTEHCEYWLTDEVDPDGSGTLKEQVCYSLEADEFEPARNLSQLSGTRTTVLDPRFSPTGGMLKKDYSSLLCNADTDGDGYGDAGEWTPCDYAADPTEEYILSYTGDILPQLETRNPSMFFATYEIGDNTVVDIDSAAVPMDMHFSRARNWGDEYEAINYLATGVNSSAIGEIVAWDFLENGPEIAAEASVYGSPDGSRFYTVWNQELEIGVDDHGEAIFDEMDVEFRRIWFDPNKDLTDFIPTTSIDYVSAYVLDQSADETLRMVAMAIDHDRLGEGDGIVSWTWFDKNTGALYCDVEWAELEECKDKDKNGVCDDCLDVDPQNMICDSKEVTTLECEKEMEMKASHLQLGLNNFSFQAMDNEGNWSNVSSVDVYVFEQIASRIRIPMIVR